MPSPSPRKPPARPRAGVAAFAALVLSLFAGAATAHASLSPLRPAPTDPVTFYGHGGYSSDGAGTTGGVLEAQVPAGSTVVQAYLYGTAQDGPGAPTLAGTQLDVAFDGQTVRLASISAVNSTSDTFQTIRGDVTAQVAAKVGSGGASTTSFTVGGGDPSIHGYGLVVIYSNPSEPEVSIAVLDGFADPVGDTATLVFADPLDKTRTGFRATMALGIGWSAGTTSDVDVNGQRLTSSAGGEDDAPGVSLITVGGVGDSTGNPDPTNPGDADDELYDLDPFLTQGDTSMTINTINSSQDDAIFVSVIEVAARAGVGLNGTLPPPFPPIVAPKTSTGGPGAPQTIQLDVPPGGTVRLLDGSTPVTSLSLPGVGSYVLDPATGIVTFTPVATFAGTTPAVTYRATSSQGATADSTFTLTVAAAPAAPVVVQLPPAATPPATIATTPPAAAPPATPAARTESCVSRRAETINWKVPSSERVTGYTVTVNGKSYKKLGKASRKVSVSMRGRKAGSVVRVIVKAKTARGKTLSTTRVYRPCRSRQEGDPLPTLMLKADKKAAAMKKAAAKDKKAVAKK